MSERFAIIGNPVSHSLSPIMQTAAFSAAGVDATYDRVRLDARGLAPWFAQMKRGEYNGCNVTLPYKQSVCELLEELDEAAETVGAVNTVVRRDKTLFGHNTDVEGFRSCLRAMSLDLQGARVVLAGTGGAARAVLYVLRGEGARTTVLSRNPQTAPNLTCLGSTTRVLDAADTGAIKKALEGAALFVNATPQGMAQLPDACPIPTKIVLEPELRIIDLIYGHETPLLARARAAGCIFLDGLEMLVQQGAAAFLLWTGVQADVNVMRGACVAALEEV